MATFEGRGQEVAAAALQGVLLPTPYFLLPYGTQDMVRMTSS